MPPVDEVLREGVLNVISDEELSFHDFFQYAQFGIEADHNEFAARFGKLIGNKFDLSLLVTVRNQPDLIFSCYAQKYRFVKQYLGDLSFSDFLSNQHGHLNRSEKEHLALFDFEHWIGLWESQFNVRAKVIFYEDLLHDKTAFFSDLSDSLSIDPEDLDTLIELKHRRQRNQTQEEISIPVKGLSSFGRSLGALWSGEDFERRLEKRFHMRSSLFLNLVKRLFYRYDHIVIPKISEQERTRIKRHFQDSNLNFALKRNLSLDKLLAYGYMDKEKIVL